MRNLTQSLTLTSLATAVRGAFRLSDLFKAGQQGLWWMPESHRAVLAARKNLLTYSEQFGNAVWVKADGATVSSNTHTAPDGTLTADTITDPGTLYGEVDSPIITAAANTAYSFSVYVRKTAGATAHPGFSLGFFGGTTKYASCSLNTNTGVAVMLPDQALGLVSVVDAGDYWRLALTSSSTAATNVMVVRMYPAVNTNGGATWSPNPSGSIVLWGAQLEIGAAATAYQRVTTESDYDWSVVTPGATPTLSQDSAGTSAVSAIEQPVGRVIDQSGRGNHAAQSTSAARPALTARVNLLTRTEDIGNSAWIKGASTVGAGGLIYPASQGPYRGAYQEVSAALRETAQNRVTFRLKSAGFRWVAILGSAGSGSSGAFFDIVNGVVGFVYPGYSANITPAPDGFYDCTVQSPVEISYYAQIVLCDENANHTATPNGTNGVIFQRASMTLGSADVPYQWVTTATDYDWQAGRLALKFDGLDDGIGANFAAGTLPANADVYLCLNRADGDGQTVLVYQNQSVYAGVLGGSGSQIGAGSPTYAVNGTPVSGGSTPSNSAFSAAVGFSRTSIVEIRNADLSAWTAFNVGGYGAGYSLSGRIFSVLICPAQTDAARARIRRRLAQIFRIQGVV